MIKSFKFTCQGLTNLSTISLEVVNTRSHKHQIFKEQRDVYLVLLCLLNTICVYL